MTATLNPDGDVCGESRLRGKVIGNGTPKNGWAGDGEQESQDSE